MLKLIIDTNVLVSSLIQRSYPFVIFDYVLMKRQIELCISDDLLNEYIDVLNRIKFFKYPDYEVRSKILLSDIKKFGIKYSPSVKIDIIKDEADNKLLELAETCNADYLITGNAKHFLMKKYKNTKIVSPKEFWELEII
ncbi:MAG TPA: putative toxin-antitoxin system toxin component, PIN family [Hanamia sp.]